MFTLTMYQVKSGLLARINSDFTRASHHSPLVPRMCKCNESIVYAIQSGHYISLLMLTSHVIRDEPIATNRRNPYYSDVFFLWQQWYDLRYTNYWEFPRRQNFIGWLSLCSKASDQNFPIGFIKAPIITIILNLLRNISTHNISELLGISI